jgi:hypothetical protein
MRRISLPAVATYAFLVAGLIVTRYSATTLMAVGAGAHELKASIEAYYVDLIQDSLASKLSLSPL